VTPQATEKEVFDLPAAIYGPGCVGMKRSHYEHMAYGGPVETLDCGCIKRTDCTVTWLCRRHSGG
jgi:hypothetical protein